MDLIDNPDKWSSDAFCPVFKKENGTSVYKCTIVFPLAVYQWRKSVKVNGCVTIGSFFYDGWTSDDDENIEPSEIVQTDTENADDNSTNPAEFQMAIEDKVTESPPNIFVCIEYHSM